MLDNLKMLVGIEAEDTDRDRLLILIIEHTTARLKRLLGGIEPPEDMQYIIVEVSVIRYNKIGSEGLTSHSVEGVSLNFTDDDFSGFKDDIQAFLDSQKESKRGRVRFI